MPDNDEHPLQERLDTLIEQHRVPGAVIGIQMQGARTFAAAGVLGTRTGVSATVDSLFKIGSITKVWTAVLIHQLTEEGLLDVDAPVVDVLPDFRLRDPDAARHITLRQLLNHTSGIDGDMYADTGRGDDALARYVDLLADVGTIHAPGAALSYCNAGYNLAGRIVEVLRGTTWERALHDRICTPLGLADTVTFAEDAILHRAAIGHVVDADGALTQTGTWAVPRSSGPSAVIATTAADLLSFSSCFLTDADASGLFRSPASPRAMLVPEHPVPIPGMGVSAWGQGWFHVDWDGHHAIGHDGASSGQRAYLRVFPDDGLVVTLLTNGGNGGALFRDLVAPVVHEQIGATAPARIDATPAAVVDDSSRPGLYVRDTERNEVYRDDDGRLRMRQTWTGALLDGEDPDDLVDEFFLRAVDESTFIASAAPDGAGEPVSFMSVDGVEMLCFLMRASPRVGGA
ncbi:serine hydrolase domain-containing protein [Microbacterium sp. NPDC089695]|uniref:serine hydrolase domain-containing protein n=1 Tax=Microbacterium sp. NPDC089695 TaxID=3364198 RepID=UPI0038250992